MTSSATSARPSPPRRAGGGGGPAGGPTRICVRVPDYLGELTMAEPAVRALVAAGLEVVAFGRPSARELLAGARVAFQDVRGAAEDTASYRAAGAAWGLALRASFSTAWRMWRAGLKVIGRRGNLRSPLLFKALPRQRPGHRIDEYLELGLLAATLAGDVSARDRSAAPVTPALHATAAQMADASARLHADGVGGPFVLCCPTVGHAGTSPFKIWPHFTAFMRALLDGGHPVTVCPAEDELDWYRGMPEGVKVIEGVGVGCLLGIVSLAAGVVSNDTGVGHVAAAAGAPTLVVFGDTSPERYAPRGPRARHIGVLGSWPSLDEVADAWRRLLSEPDARSTR